MAENAAGRQRQSRDSMSEIAKNTRLAAALLQVGITLPAGAATEVTLAALLTELQLKANLSDSQPISLPTGTETPSLTSVTSSGTIAAGAKSVSILNIGTSDGAVLGTTLPPGISVSFKASEGKTLTAIAYVATASSELLISTTV